MLPKNKRIRKEYFDQIMRVGRVFHSTHFSLRVLFGSKTGFAVVVSKKIAPLAVGRNKLRRRAYSVVGKVLPRVKKVALGVLSAKSGAAAQSFSDQKQEILELFEKAGVI